MISRYIEDINKYEPLTKKEERELMAKAKQGHT